MASGTAWSIKLAGASRMLHFEVADPERHGMLLHDWMHRPHVAPWWGADRSLQETREYIERQLRTGHLTPWIVDAGHLPFGYVETYRAAEDPLADAYPLHASDRGWHVLVGPAEVLGKGLPRLMGRAVLARLLSEPGGDVGMVDGPGSGGETGGGSPGGSGGGLGAGGVAPVGAVDRVVCEPDERNGRMIAFCEALGYERLASLDLGFKRAALLACTQDRFADLWPGDLAAGAASYRVGRNGAAQPGAGAAAGGEGRTPPTTEATEAGSR